MWVIPAIDLKAGHVVRLTRGVREEETVYSDNPVGVLKGWEKEGAKLVHVVDLDGALEGETRNFELVRQLLAAANVPVQLGGGLRTLEAVERALGAGVWRIVIGTKVLDQEFVAQLVKKFGERIVVGLDVRKGILQTHGWQKPVASFHLGRMCQDLEGSGIRTVIVTDIDRDGTLQGPNLDLIRQVLATSRIEVIASGGVSDWNHLEQMSEIKNPNFKGVIVGKALYEGKFSLRQAVDRFQMD